jgi:hypothetical protein
MLGYNTSINSLTTQFDTYIFNYKFNLRKTLMKNANTTFDQGELPLS